MQKKEYKTLPLKIKYKDKIQLTRSLLEIYSINYVRLTGRDIDVLTITILEGLNNSKEVSKMLLSSEIGFKSQEQVYTQFSKLRKKGLIYKDERYKKDNFNNELKKIEQLVNASDDHHVSLCLGYERV